MHLVPYGRLTLRCEDEPDVVLRRLRTMTDETPGDGACTTFWGTFEGTTFKLFHAPRPSFGRRGADVWQPVIVGSVRRVPGATEVRARVRLKASDALFALLVCAALVYQGTHTGFLVPGALIAIIYAIWTVRFWAGVKRDAAEMCGGLLCQRVERPDRSVLVR